MGIRSCYGFSSAWHHGFGEPESDHVRGGISFPQDPPYGQTTSVVGIVSFVSGTVRQRP